MSGHPFTSAVMAMIWILPGLLLYIALFILLLTVPFVPGWLGRKRQRLLFAADRFCCEACGHKLGLDAPMLADAARKDEAWHPSREPPRLWPRPIRNLQAICPFCRARYGFDDRTGRFILLERIIE